MSNVASIFQNGVAQPIYLVDANGNPITASNPLGVNASFSASSIAINDPTATTQKMAVDASGNASVKLGAALPAGSNLIGGAQLVDSAGTNKASISAGGAVKVDNSGVTQPVSGSVTVTQGTGSNLHAVLDAGSALIGGVNVVDSAGSNKLAVDSSGRVTLVPNQSVNVAQIAGAAPSASNTLPTANYIGGAAVSVSNPYPSADQIRLWIVNGQGFSASTGKLTAAGAITGAFSIFNPSASGKTIIVFSMKFNIGNNSYNNISYVTSDPALTAATILNRHATSATASVASVTYANTNQTQSGTTNDTVSGASNTPLQVLQNGDVFYLPAGRGVVFWSNLSAANAWSVSAQWIEV